MRRILGVATALAVAIPVTSAFAADLAVGTVAAFNAGECSLRLRSDAVFYQLVQEADECVVLSVGDRVRITFDNVSGRNEVVEINRFEPTYAIGLVAEVTAETLKLTTGAEFNIVDMDTPTTVAVGDYVRIEFNRTMGGTNIAETITVVPVDDDLELVAAD